MLFVLSAFSLQVDLFGGSSMFTVCFCLYVVFEPNKYMVTVSYNYYPAVDQLAFVLLVGEYQWEFVN